MKRRSSSAITDYSDYQHAERFAGSGSRPLLEEHSRSARGSTPFPIAVNDKAALAAQAAEAAGEQDRFWEMHQLLYTQQENWVTLSVAGFEQWLSAQVSALGMDLEQFQAISSGRCRCEVRKPGKGRGSVCRGHR
jgi:hypothetical protein